MRRSPFEKEIQKSCPRCKARLDSKKAKEQLRNKAKVESGSLTSQEVKKVR